MAMAQAREQMAEAKLRRKMDRTQTKVDRARMMAINQANRWRNCEGFSRVIVHVPNMSKIDIPNLPDIDLFDVPKVDVDVHFAGNDPI